MSKTSSFLLAFLLYAAAAAAALFALQGQHLRDFGTESVEIILSEHISQKLDLSQNYETESKPSPAAANSFEPIANEGVSGEISEPAPQELPTPPAPPAQPTTPAQSAPDVNDLFEQVNTSEQIAAEIAAKKAQQARKTAAAKRALAALASPAAASQSTEQSAQIMGISDAYFSRVSAYLKNIWGLVAPGYQIAEQDFLQLPFSIAADGSLRVGAGAFSQGAIGQAAAEFARRVNAAAANFGPPPSGRAFSAKVRLGVKFSASLK